MRFQIDTLTETKNKMFIALDFMKCKKMIKKIKIHKLEFYFDILLSVKQAGFTTFESFFYFFKLHKITSYQYICLGFYGDKFTTAIRITPPLF